MDDKFYRVFIDVTEASAVSIVRAKNKTEAKQKIQAYLDEEALYDSQLRRFLITKGEITSVKEEIDLDK